MTQKKLVVDPPSKLKTSTWKIKVSCEPACSRSNLDLKIVSVLKSLPLSHNEADMRKAFFWDLSFERSHNNLKGIIHIIEAR